MRFSPLQNSASRFFLPLMMGGIWISNPSCCRFTRCYWANPYWVLFLLAL